MKNMGDDAASQPHEGNPESTPTDIKKADGALERVGEILGGPGANQATHGGVSSPNRAASWAAPREGGGGLHPLYVCCSRSQATIGMRVYPKTIHK
jgi:hypothetical protein